MFVLDYVAGTFLYGIRRVSDPERKRHVPARRARVTECTVTEVVLFLSVKTLQSGRPGAWRSPKPLERRELGHARGGQSGSR